MNERCEILKGIAAAIIGTVAGCAVALVGIHWLILGRPF